MPHLVLPPPDPGPAVADRQQGFSGGLNTTADPAFLAPNQARVMTNYGLSTYGAATKRFGSRAVLGSGSPATGTSGNIALHWPLKSMIITQSGGTLYSLQRAQNFSNPLWNLTNLTSLGTSSDSSSVIFSDGTNEVVYINGATSVTAFALQKFDGTTLSTISAAVHVTGLCVYNQRLWGFRANPGLATETPNSIYYSNLSTASGSIGGDSLGVGASGGGQIIVTTFGASRIRALAAVGGSLMIFHAKGVSRLTGFGQSDTTVVPQAVSQVVAALSQNAVCVNESTAYVATTQGIYVVTENGEQLLGTPTNPDPTGAVIRTAANGPSTQTFINRAKSELWVMIPAIGTYVYNLVLGAWSGPYTGAAFGSTGNGSNYFELVDGNSVTQALTAPDLTGVLYEADTPNYTLDAVAVDGTGGSAYTSTVQCHRMFGFSGGAQTSGAVAKSWTLAATLATLTTGGTAPSMGYSTVYGGSGSTTFTTPSSAEKAYYTAVGGSGPYIDLTITDTGSTASQVATVDVQGQVVGIL